MEFFKNLRKTPNKKRGGYSRNSYSYASSDARSSERTEARRAAYEKKTAPGKGAGFFASVWNTVSLFFAELWAKLMSLDRRVLACIAASVFIVIAVPVVIAIARPAPAKKDDAPVSSAPLVSAQVSEGEVLTGAAPSASAITVTPSPEPTPVLYAKAGEEGEHVASRQIVYPTENAAYRLVNSVKHFLAVVLSVSTIFLSFYLFIIGFWRNINTFNPASAFFGNGILASGNKWIAPKYPAYRKKKADKKATFLKCLNGIGGTSRSKSTSRVSFKG